MGSRRRLFLVLFMILALVAAAGVIDVAMARELRRQDRTINRLSKSAADLSSQVRSEQAALNALSDRLSAAEAELRSQPNLAEVAQRVSHSVFTIQAGNRLGTGFVTSSSDGGTSILVTNFHVIQDVWNAGGRTVSVSQGKRSFDGTIVRVNTGKDLAAVQVSRMLPPLEVSQDLPGIGASVLVLGSPEGLEGTVASGIVSAIRGQYIQFSAPVSPGDSGGPLVDDQGRVLGVVVSKIEATGAEGLSFAIPIAVACQTVLSC